MLLFVLASTALGLVVPRLGRREQWVLSIAAGIVTLVYATNGSRFMT
jgi:hypothetical protein